MTNNCEIMVKMPDEHEYFQEMTKLLEPKESFELPRENGWVILRFVFYRACQAQTGLYVLMAEAGDTWAYGTIRCTGINYTQTIKGPEWRNVQSPYYIRESHFGRRLTPFTPDAD